MTSTFRGDFDKTQFLESSDVLNVVLEHVSHGLVVVGKDYRLLAFNRVMDSIFQLPEGTFRIGLDFRRILEVWAEQTGQPPAMLQRAIRELDEKEAFIFEHCQDIHGQTRWVQLMHNPLPSGGFVRTFLDITERKQVELALQEAVEELEQANTAKDQFLRLVSHDLRAPIAGLVGLLQLLRTDERMTEPHQQELLEVGISGATSLLSLTEHLLKVSRIKSGAIIPQKKPIALSGIVDEIHSRHAPALKQKGIACEIDIRPDTLWLADRVLIGEVFDNLFSNSLKFCDSGDSVFLLQLDNDTIEFKDTGPGIPDTYIPHLFRHEVRTQSTGTKGETGSGLGLPHCADIMVAHGGEITAVPDTSGAHFSLRLPNHEQSVLIVDDQAAHRAMIRSSIKKVGTFNMLEAGNGKDALDILDVYLPDVAIIDLEMPELDGWELLKTLRNRSNTAKLPIMVASSHLHGETEHTAKLKSELMNLGANTVAIKPIDSESFNRSFLRLLRS